MTKPPHHKAAAAQPGDKQSPQTPPAFDNTEADHWAAVHAARAPEQVNKSSLMSWDAAYKQSTPVGPPAAEQAIATESKERYSLDLSHLWHLPTHSPLRSVEHIVNQEKK